MEKKKNIMAAVGPRLSNRVFWSLAIALWALAVLIRLLPSEMIADSDGSLAAFYTHDSGYHGYQAQAALGEVPARGEIKLTALLPAALARVLSVTLDESLLYLPVFLAPLVIFPLAWLGRRFGMDWGALLAAGLAAFAAGFYQRSHIGYYDSDILNVFFPLLLIVLFIKAFETKKLLPVALLVAVALLCEWWYGSARAMLYMMAGLAALYVLAFRRKDAGCWHVVVVFGLSVLAPGLGARAVLGAGAVLALFVVLPLLGRKLAVVRRFLSVWIIWPLGLGLGAVLALLFVNQAAILGPVWSYLERVDSLEVTTAAGQLRFASAVETVIESRGVAPTLYMKTVAGASALFIVSVAGFFWLAWRKREALFLAPLVLLGVLGFVSGIRFSIYLAPVLLLGMAYLAEQGAARIAGKSRIYMTALVFIFFIPSLYYNGREFGRWNREVIVPVLSHAQGTVLEKVAGESKDAWAFSWWDYGWPLWYHGGWKTLVDNGEHGAIDSYAVSRALLSADQKYLAGTAGWMCAEKARRPSAPALGGLLEKEGSLAGVLRLFATGCPATNAAARVSIVLPRQMDLLLYTIYKFSSLDPLTGKEPVDKPFWFVGRIESRSASRTAVVQEFTPRMFAKKARLFIDVANGQVEIDGRVATLSRIVTVTRTAGNGVAVEERRVGNGSGLVLVLDGDAVLLMSEPFFASNFVQMALLQRIDENVFIRQHVSRDLVVVGLRPQTGR